jgi:hypothetical protein
MNGVGNCVAHRRPAGGYAGSVPRALELYVGVKALWFDESLRAIRGDIVLPHRG